MQFKNNIPCLQDGVELSKIAFSGGRLTASIASHGGLMVLDYYSARPFASLRKHSRIQVHRASARPTKKPASKPRIRRP